MDRVGGIELFLSLTEEMGETVGASPSDDSGVKAIVSLGT